ncbi:GNAT family N-acetyltransferase [Kroppenstedtia eburnea]|uniref:Acetyltransferase (GNAT) family protein n=1 Tax=Kroppenstedtia eburnea TaxID=714067 RepID=A0A1N7NVH7_9BACL|nr:GNAT family N-acetyltransferase [Kroppenstedtia eburnea]EGK08573.1 GNAT family acetyltransferase [Desmospora sp. 8437]QKI81183.1 GNAT family N-acetyltransferase [Kroppenstedtia eburnea]SIT02334.1 Acetyltransferase (GNAT) family protein [Kroppenstedtia eburnea]
MNIRELTTEAEWRRAYPVMKELRTHLEPESYLQLVQEMRGEGYRLFALEEDGEILAVTGVTIRTTLYYGKHLFIHDLVTRADRRSRGCGERLLSYVEEWGRSRGCGSVALTSGLARRDAHRFYEERMGYDRVSHVFRKIF